MSRIQQPILSKEMAKLLGVSLVTLHKYVTLGYVPCPKVTSRKAGGVQRVWPAELRGPAEDVGNRRAAGSSIELLGDLWPSPDA